MDAYVNATAAVPNAICYRCGLPYTVGNVHHCPTGAVSYYFSPAAYPSSPNAYPSNPDAYPSSPTAAPSGV